MRTKFDTQVAEPSGTDLFGSAFVIAYKIFGLQPGLSEGLIFNSCVMNLQSQPDLWLDECPFLYPRFSSRLLDGLRVEPVAQDNAAPQPAHRVAVHT